MLERNGIQCWLTTTEHVILPEILTSTGETDVVTCTVQLQTRKSYIIHWLSKSPLTAWCEIHTKSANGKTTTGIAKCEMDATNPSTQQRSSNEGTAAGRNLGFHGRLPTAPSIGMAWLEIRRATAINFSEITNGERQVTIEWVPSDHPEVGAPFATFVFNFELVSPLAEELSSPAAAGQVLSPASAQTRSSRSLRLDSLFFGQKEPDDKFTLRSLFPSPADVTAGPASSNSLPSGSSPTSRTGEGMPITPSSANTVVSPNPITQQSNIRDFEDTTEPGPSRKRPVHTVESLFSVLSNAKHNAKRSRLNASPGPSSVASVLERLPMRAAGDIHTRDTNNEHYAIKIARVENEIDSQTRKFNILQEKERYLLAKQEWAQLSADIQSAELECGPLSPRRSFFDDWNPKYDSDHADDFAVKRGKIEIDLAALRKHWTALKEKKTYREKKATLKQLKADIQVMERRCEELSSNISRIMASAPALRTPGT